MCIQPAAWEKARLETKVDDACRLPIPYHMLEAHVTPAVTQYRRENHRQRLVDAKVLLQSHAKTRGRKTVVAEERGRSCYRSESPRLPMATSAAWNNNRYPFSRCSTPPSPLSVKPIRPPPVAPSVILNLEGNFNWTTKDPAESFLCFWMLQENSLVNEEKKSLRLLWIGDLCLLLILPFFLTTGKAM